MIEDVSPEVVDRVMLKTKLLFVDAWAPWCSPCKALGPILVDLDEKYADNPNVGFLKVNTQEHPRFAEEYQIHAIPCVLLFFEGKPASYSLKNPKTGETRHVDRLIGLRPAEHYEDVITSLLG
ncbi:MAG: thioredoxin family protein [Candidatus Thorarchaeota archaeon]